MVPVRGPDSLEYPTAEHAYQAAKLGYLRNFEGTDDLARHRTALLDIRTSWKAAREIGVRVLDPLLNAGAWDRARPKILGDLATQRYSADGALRRVLHETRGVTLRYAMAPEHQEGLDAPWWGCRRNVKGRWDGRNALGQVWMGLRRTRRAAAVPRLVPEERRINAVFVALRLGTDILVCRPGAALHYPGRDGIRDRGWHLPGGCVDPGETGTFADTGRREFEEEVGARVPSAAKLVKDEVWRDRRNPQNDIRFCLLSLPAGSAWDAPRRSEEMEEIRWLPQRTLARGGETIRAVAALLARTFIVPRRR
jgi:8-oxo-dGTP pyrophosphatase MutT (NUDIX family)/predicted NAD-dependent protein-ADP-ribosyltransferase YbiA (DUF1768 family)